MKYLYGAGRRNEHTDAHMVASWDGYPAGLEPEFMTGLGVHNVAPLVRLLEQPVRACDRAPAEFVYHLVLRNAPEVRPLSDEEWAGVCIEAMSGTGIAPEGDPAGCRWVAVRHVEDHVHLVATLAREDGRPPKTWGDWDRIAEVRHEFPRVTLRTKVKTAAAISHGFAEFVDRLAAEGVTVWPRMSERNPDEITGYSVSLDDWTNAAGDPVRFGGGKLAPDLSWPKLSARWEPARTEQIPSDAPTAGRHAAPDEPFPGRPAAPRTPLTAEEAEYVWRKAERIVREAADTITAEAGSDPDAAADAAWGASDTLSGAAAGLEGEAGGPITDAAEAFDRAGRDCYRRIPARSHTGTALRSAGRMMALLAPGTKHPGAQVVGVTVALAALAAAVADLRQSQQRLHQAEAALASAEQLRRVAPPPQTAAATGPRRPRNAADLAAMSFSSKPFRVRPTKVTPAASKKAAEQTVEELRRRRGPGQGHGPSQS